MPGTMICILEISSQMPNHWPNVGMPFLKFLIEEFLLPWRCLFCIFLEAEQKQEHLKKREGAASDCQVKYSFVIEVSCPPLCVGLHNLFLYSLKKKSKTLAQTGTPPNFELK